MIRVLIVKIIFVLYFWQGLGDGNLLLNCHL